MEYFILETSEAVYLSQLRERFPNATFGDYPQDDLLALLGVKRIVQTPAPLVTRNQKVAPDGYEEINGTYRLKWLVSDKTQPELDQMFVDAKRQALIQINNDDNKIYADVIGNKTTEYLKAAEDARAFKAAGYPENDVPDYVQSWAEAKLWTATQACDDIINQELLWQGAAKLIRDYRLKAKEAVKRATSIEEVEAAMSIWNGFVFTIRSQLGV